MSALLSRQRATTPSPAKGPGYEKIKKLRGQDSNLRPRGYEPRELPDCSTPRPIYLYLFIFFCPGPGRAANGKRGILQQIDGKSTSQF